MNLNILFINAIDKTRTIESSCPPLGLGYLVSSLRKEFGRNLLKFKIVDEQIEEEIKKFKPDIVAISAVSQNYNRAVYYAKLAKKYKLPVIIGGIHITSLPSSLSREMDLGVIGEGEETIIKLINLYLKEGCFNKKKLNKIAGIVFRDKEEIILTEKRKPIKPLDKIPFPARDLISIKKSTSMFTSRGCPYKCSFCASTQFWCKVRFFSAQYVVQEIKYLVEKHQVEHIEFWDDLFIADRERLKEIIKLLKNEKLLGKISFGCNTRANLIDKELCWLLKQMNFKNVCMGLESSTPRILKYLKGESIKVEDHLKAIKALRKARVKPHATFIIGSPKETKKEILETLKFIKRSKLNNFDVYVLTPFPKTPVWEYAKKKNLVGENMDWRNLNVDFEQNYKKAIILSETLSRQQMHKLFLKFIKEKERRKRRNLIWEIPTKLVKMIKKQLSK